MEGSELEHLYFSEAVFCVLEYLRICVFSHLLSTQARWAGIVVWRDPSFISRL